MGRRWEVWQWVKVSDAQFAFPAEDPDDYKYETVPCRDSALAALWAAWRAKRTAGCVRIEWRG
jgi:hypothetical protein